MKKICLSGIVAGISMIIVAFGLCCVFGALFPQLNEQYLNKDLFIQYGNPRMCLFWVYYFIVAFILAFLWDKTKGLIVKRGIVSRGVQFGLLYSLIVFPGLVISYATSPYSLLMVATWMLSIITVNIVSGLILEAINK